MGMPSLWNITTEKAALKNVLSEHKCSLVWHTLPGAMDLHAPSCSSQHAPIPKGMQGWGKKATGPREAVSHLCSRFNDWLQRESVLEAWNFFPEWQVSLSSPVWTRQLHSETHDDKITQRTVCLRGCTKTRKQSPSPPSFCTQHITVTAFPQNYLPVLQQSLCLLQLSDVFKNLLVEPGLARATTFFRPLMQNENFPYSFIPMQLWRGRSSHCTATQHRGVLHGLAMLLSPFPYYSQETCKGFFTSPCLHLKITAPLTSPASGSAAGRPCSLCHGKKKPQAGRTRELVASNLLKQSSPFSKASNKQSQ